MHSSAGIGSTGTTCSRQEQCGFLVGSGPECGRRGRPEPKGYHGGFGAWKPWTVRNGENIRFWIAQPEGRYWFCEAFEGHFIGAHILGAQYYLQHNGRIYDGFLAGSGFTYGYDWVLSPRWNLEALIGFGYARLWYKERPDLPCDRCARERSRNYLGPTAVSLSVSYLF